jgi:hypothetical protein
MPSILAEYVTLSLASSATMASMSSLLEAEEAAEGREEERKGLCV